MKAITLYQPWAQFVALRVKRIETRSWYTSYRGLLAIHAGINMPKWAKELCWQEPFRSILVERGLPLSFSGWPFGKIVATCILADCVKIKQTDGIMAWLDKGYVADDYEYPFGDYTPGRFGWILKEIKPLSTSIPAVGHQGLWNWEEGDNLAI